MKSKDSRIQIMNAISNAQKANSSFLKKPRNERSHGNLNSLLPALGSRRSSINRSPSTGADTHAEGGTRDKVVRFKDAGRRLTIQDFELLSVLGKGGYSTAWKVNFSERPHSHFALKVTSKQE